TASSGDGVAGQVIGAVTSAGGSASIVAANKSTNSDVETGSGDASNDLTAFVGLNRTSSGDVDISDFTGSCRNAGTGCNNAQDGNNRFSGSQNADASSGDGVAGQVLGVVSAGAASVDATNTTNDSSVQTGNTDASNDGEVFVGLNRTSSGDLTISDITGANADNLQDGNNTKTLAQTASATSGDGVAGQVSGVVTSAGGSASVVLANSSTNIDSTSGDSNFSNDQAGFVGMNTSSGIGLDALPVVRG